MDDLIKMDDREPLQPGCTLKIREENKKVKNEYSISIRSEAGRGAGCIVYHAELVRYIDGREISASVIVKELYPTDMGIKRDISDRQTFVIPSGKQKAFEGFRYIFSEGQSEYSGYYEYAKDHTLPRPFIYGYANNTVYAVSDSGKGRVLSEIDRNDLNLEMIASVMDGVCKAIRPFHTRELLYLDCKSNNFFYHYDKTGTGAVVYLFDFDTVTSLSDIRRGANRFSPYTPGWAAPEQIPSELDGRYKDPSVIGYHTDIYSIGVLFFWLITGRVPSEDDISAVNNMTFDWERECPVCRGYAAEVISLISDLEKCTLEQDPMIRRENFKHHVAIKAVEKQFGILRGLTVGDDVCYEPLHVRLTGLSEIVKDTDRKIDISQEEIKETIKKHSVQGFFFGTKKRAVRTICVLAAAAVAAGFLIRIGTQAADNIIPKEVIAGEQVKEEVLDDHVIFELSKADHDYKTGIENWIRLDYNRAERDIRKAYERMSAAAPVTDADLAKINNTLGCLYLDMGRYQESYELLNDAYVTFGTLYGEDSDQVRAARFSIAQYDYLKGDPSTALKTIQLITDSSEQKNDKALTATALSYKAKIYNDLGDHQKALETYDELFLLYEDILKDGGLTEEYARLNADKSLSQSEKDDQAAALSRILTAMCDKGAALYSAEEYEEAEEVLRNAIEIGEDNIYIGRKNLITSKLYMNLAKVCAARRNTKDAMDHIDLAMRIQKNLFDYQETYPGLVEVYDLYGDLIVKKGEVGSYDRYRSAYDLAMQSYGENHPVTAEAVYCMGKYYAFVNYPDEAVSYFTQAIDIRKNILGYDHESTVRYLYSMAQAYYDAGDKENALSNVKEAVSIADKLGIHGRIREDLSKLYSEFL